MSHPHYYDRKTPPFSLFSLKQPETASPTATRSPSVSSTRPLLSSPSVDHLRSTTCPTTKLSDLPSFSPSSSLHLHNRRAPPLFSFPSPQTIHKSVSDLFLLHLLFSP
ncbi:hypothetical protein HAX54_034827 [Datura stramonium]|uniref:Uncharacterized protein n=1 Tax=Datura stramonium TaxID=4076 RepID=A0ABS8VEP9_DATST|nr:hypothetical protein [Datura stramonium]